MNVRFGLYLIPDASTEFYRLGSQVVGYDVREQKEVPLFPFIQPSWVERNRQFGFHATITDAITVDETALDDILSKAETLINCLNPSTYLLTKVRVGFWRDSSNMAAVIMKPNRAVELLHDMLVACLHPLGHGSEYYDAYRVNPEAFLSYTPAALQKLKQFYSPYILDEFVPHFTCIHSYDGVATGRQALELKLEEVFAGIGEVRFSKIAFVRQNEGEDYFTIVREFLLPVGE